MSRPRLTPKRVRGLCDLEMLALETEPGTVASADDLWAALRYIRELRQWYHATRPTPFALAVRNGTLCPRCEAEPCKCGKTPS